MKVLVTGSKGQLGLSIKNRIKSFPDLTCTFTDIEELDITHQQELQKFIAANKFECIINCAAYTAVDKAEDEAERAYTINAIAVKYLAKISAKYNIALIHISTDYVFDGNKFTPYLETDKPKPQGIYAKTKYEAEKQLLKLASHAIIFRTSWLYSEYGNNFVKTIKKLAGQKQELKVVNDQIGSPTYAGDLANVILTLVSSHSIPEGVRIYNYANEGVASWYDFAHAIIELENSKCRIIPIPTSEYPLASPRPFYSVLNKEKVKRENKIEIPYWRDSLKICLSNLGHK